MVERLSKILTRHRKIGLDTSIFIYQIEKNQKYHLLTDKIFNWLLKSKSFAVTSTITMLELLVQPYRLKDYDLVNKFYALLTTYPNLSWVAPTLEIVDKAALLRAFYNLKTPDAIQVATALQLNTKGFIANDPVYKRVSDLEVTILDELF